MFRRLARNPLTMLTALTAVFALYMGCAQTQPVSAPFSKATINLSPRAFPSPPTGMIYELWVQRLNGDNKSLGRFGWDQDLYVMRDIDGAARERTFNADFNILDWDFLSVSIENIDSPSVSGPGPIFLRDTIFAPDQREFLLMKYPIDFSALTSGFVSLETPTDGDLSHDSAGVWFAIYSRANIRTQDTTGASATELVQLPRDHFTDDTSGTTMDTIGIDSVIQVTYERYSRFNLDTFTINTVRRYFTVVPINKLDTLGITMIDTTVIIDSSMVPPDTSLQIDTSYSVDSSSVRYITPQYVTPGGITYGPDTVDYGADKNFVMQPSIDTTASIVTPVSQFDNGFTELFDLNGSGWHYKGWVLGPYGGNSPQKFVRMNIGENKELNWEKKGRTLFSTGIFYDSLITQTLNRLDTTFYGKNTDGSDSIIVRSVYDYSGEDGYNTVGSNSNPYSAQPPRGVPPFPGEDFLNPPIVTGATGPTFDFRGSVFDTTIAFITVEPDNYHDSTKNFPLILLAEEINFRRGTDDFGAGFPAGGGFNNIELRNQSPVNFPIANKRKSWPHILVDITVE